MRSTKNFHGLQHFTASFHPDQMLSPLQSLPVLGQLGEKQFTITLRCHPSVVIPTLTLHYTPLALMMPRCRSHHNRLLACCALQGISRPPHYLCSLVFHPNLHHCRSQLYNLHHYHSQLPKLCCHYPNGTPHPLLHDRSLRLW